MVGVKFKLRVVAVLFQKLTKIFQVRKPSGAVLLGSYGRCGHGRAFVFGRINGPPVAVKDF